MSVTFVNPETNELILGMVTDSVDVVVGDIVVINGNEPWRVVQRALIIDTETAPRLLDDYTIEHTPFNLTVQCAILPCAMLEEML